MIELLRLLLLQQPQYKQVQLSKLLPLLGPLLQRLHKRRHWYQGLLLNPSQLLALRRVLR